MTKQNDIEVNKRILKNAEEAIRKGCICISFEKPFCLEYNPKCPYHNKSKSKEIK